MATQHSEDSLKGLKKDDLIKLVLKIQNETDSKLDILTKEVRDAFQRIEADIAVVRNTNSLLQKRVIDLERECHASSQYSRRECLEIIGISESVPHDELEGKVLEIFEKIDVKLVEEKIECCHRLRDKNTTIVKLSSRKDTLNILKSKKKLKDLDLSTLSFDTGSKLYINESLTWYYKSLWSKCKQLYNNKLISSFYTINGINKIKIRETSPAISITHNADLAERFPDFNFDNPAEGFANLYPK